MSVAHRSGAAGHRSMGTAALRMAKGCLDSLASHPAVPTRRVVWKAVVPPQCICSASTSSNLETPPKAVLQFLPVTSPLACPIATPQLQRFHQPESLEELEATVKAAHEAGA